MNVRGAIFDLDGTLFDSHPALCAAYNEVLARFGHPRLPPKEVLESLGANEREKLASYVGASRYAEARELLRVLVMASLPEIPLFDGVREMLDELKARGLSLAVATSRHRPSTQALLTQAGLLSHFVTVVTYEDVKEPKPGPDSLLLCLERMKLAPREVMMVGDSWKDARAATSAGVACVAVLWDGLANRTELEAHSPVYWAKSPAGLLEITAVNHTGKCR